ncbi:two-component system, NtrC family, sensor histidine kinase AtoS [Gracilibacillus ureilyticus]|uniref:histidine kinase n=1 Tax=Gracilibacillus ureilyticus TaxID=531814 RepID=A0A1H9LUY0_9BACI|nr:ATP-binding protein [Gracilibacillus ureilyticus]SER15292.1 two-component system, NtrC family, sensor histidine kinase AtoS [Gracilibacillus ureilyticus]
MSNFIKQLSLRNKLLTILLIILVIFSGFSIFLIQSIDEISKVTNKIKDDNLPNLVWYNHLEKELKIKKNLVEAHVNYQTHEEFIEEYESIVQTLERESIEEITELPNSIEQLNNRVMLLDFIITNKVAGLLEYREKDAAESVLQNEYLPEVNSIITEIETKRLNELNSFDNNTKAFPVIIEKSIYILLVLTFLGVIVSVYLSYRMSRNMTKPIEEMVEKVDKVANGDYGILLNQPRQIEFRSLAISINRMSQSLQQSFQKIIRDKLKHEQILNSLPIGIITYDKNEKEYTANSFVNNLLGMDINKLSNSISLENIETNPLIQMFLSEENYFNKKISVPLQNEEYVFLVSQTDLKDSHDMHTGRIFYFIDITESTYLEKRIVQSEKLALVGEMAASSAHEIRNPLTVIHGFLTLMQESLNAEELKRFNFTLIMKEIERLYEIVEQMLLMSHQKEPEKRPIKVSEILNELIPLLQSTFDAKSIRFSMNLADQEVLADSKQLKQVFLNLIRNSLEAIGAQGSIKIVSFVRRKEIILRIQDSGPGVPDSIKHTLFEPFSTSKSNGTGLGLNVVSNIIKSHQGSISLYESDSSGTTFEIVLPIV